VTAPTIQPGTRCECRAGHDSGAACCNYSLSYERRAELERVPELIETCQADAVRMVMLFEDGSPWVINKSGTVDHIPMCSACAEYAESKAGAR
jgi:hypothetical protein